MRLNGTGGDRSQGGMSTLADGHMLASSVGRIVGCMTVIRGHRMPEGLECIRDTVVCGQQDFRVSNCGFLTDSP